MSLLCIKGLKVKKGCPVNIFCIDINETPYSRVELFERLSTFKGFCEKWSITAAELDEIVKKLAIIDNSLFEFTTFGQEPYSLPIAENAIYSEKRKWRHGQYITEVQEYNVNICASEFVSLAFNKVGEYIVRQRFPLFYEEPFVEYAPKFPKEITDKLPQNKDTSLKDLDNNILSEFTIGDLIKYYTTPDIFDLVSPKSLLKVYGDGNMYLYLEKKREKYCYTPCLSLNIECLMKKDWEGIENIGVISIPLGNGKFYEGPQKGAPYFNHPLVEVVKKHIV